MNELEQLKIENEKLNARLSKAIEVFKEQKSKIASYETELNNYKNSVQTSEVSIQTHSDEEFIEMSNKLDDLALQLQDKVSELEEQVRKYEYWVNRLQEFMDLPEDQRTEAFKTYCAEMKTSQELNDLTNVYMNMFNRLFSIY